MSAAPHSLGQRAGRLCADPLFQKFIDIKRRSVGQPTIDAADYVRQLCEVKSRRDIMSGTVAAMRLDFVESAFLAWRDRDKYVELIEK
jgi:hypothetical protein